jgi:hypothetical protein
MSNTKDDPKFKFVCDAVHDVSPYFTLDYVGAVRCSKLYSVDIFGLYLAGIVATAKGAMVVPFNKLSVRSRRKAHTTRSSLREALNKEIHRAWGNLAPSFVESGLHTPTT